MAGPTSAPPIGRALRIVSTFTLHPHTELRKSLPGEPRSITGTSPRSIVLSGLRSSSLLDSRSSDPVAGLVVAALGANEGRAAWTSGGLCAGFRRKPRPAS